MPDTDTGTSDTDHCGADFAGGRCQYYLAGHATHFIQAKLVGRTPWGWRDALVTTVDGHTAALAYLDGSATPRIWHHTLLDRALAAGDPVRLHEEFHVLGTRSGWRNVRVTGGAGKVPEPADPGTWRAETTAGIVNLATGQALPLDHPATGEAAPGDSSTSGGARCG